MDGIINVYKPAGMTSHDVVNKMRRIAGTKKVGHTGTLDPDAEGVLPVCINRATKVADMLTFSDKRYTASFKLGIVTDTYDIGGNVISQCDACVTKEQIENTISSYIGEIEQIPPMYSAIKIGGKKLCDLARKGIEIERKPRNIKIYSINLIDVKDDTFTIDVSCSKGTYIRSLGYDIGQTLGCGAVMTKLIRTQSSVFKIENSVLLDDINSENYKDFMISPDSLFDCDSIVVKDNALKKILNGNSVAMNGLNDGKEYKVYDDKGVFLCLSVAENNVLKVKKMFYVGD